MDSPASTRSPSSKVLKAARLRLGRENKGTVDVTNPRSVWGQADQGRESPRKGLFRRVSSLARFRNSSFYRKAKAAKEQKPYLTSQEPDKAPTIREKAEAMLEYYVRGGTVDNTMAVLNGRRIQPANLSEYADSIMVDLVDQGFDEHLVEVEAEPPTGTVYVYLDDRIKEKLQSLQALLLKHGEAKLVSTPEDSPQLGTYVLSIKNERFREESPPVEPEKESLRLDGRHECRTETLGRPWPCSRCGRTQPAEALVLVVPDEKLLLCQECAPGPLKEAGEEEAPTEPGFPKPGYPTRDKSGGPLVPEKDVAKKMKAKGYKYAIIFDPKHGMLPLYTKDTTQAAQVISRDYKDKAKGARVVPIDDIDALTKGEGRRAWPLELLLTEEGKVICPECGKPLLYSEEGDVFTCGSCGRVYDANPDGISPRAQEGQAAVEIANKLPKVDAPSAGQIEEVPGAEMGAVGTPPAGAADAIDPMPVLDPEGSPKETQPAPVSLGPQRATVEKPPVVPEEPVDTDIPPPDEDEEPEPEGGEEEEPAGEEGEDEDEEAEESFTLGISRELIAEASVRPGDILLDVEGHTAYKVLRLAAGRVVLQEQVPLSAASLTVDPSPFTGGSEGSLPSSQVDGRLQAGKWRKLESEGCVDLVFRPGEGRQRLARWYGSLLESRAPYPRMTFLDGDGRVRVRLRAASLKEMLPRIQEVFRPPSIREEIVDERLVCPNCVTILDQIQEKSARCTKCGYMVEVAPPGWEGTVKSMKKSKKVANPWALAWWMKGKGYRSKKAKK